MVEFLPFCVPRGEPRAAWIPVQLEPLARADELDPLPSMLHRPLPRDLHPEGFRVEPERARQVPHPDSRIMEAILHVGADGGDGERVFSRQKAGSKGIPIPWERAADAS